MIATRLGSGNFTAAEAKTVKDSSGRAVGVLVVLQYGPALTAATDATSIDTVLDSLIRGVSGFVSGALISADAVYYGFQVRSVHREGMAAAVAYERGGRVIQLVGEDPAELDRFLTSFFGVERHP